MTQRGGTQRKRGVTAPAELGTKGKAAWKRTIETLKERGIEDPSPYLDTVLRYARSIEDEEGARKVWVEEGRPVTTMGGATGSVEVQHPLIKIVQESAKFANELAKQLGLDPTTINRASSARPGAGGRPPGSASARDRKMDPEPPRILAPLRAVQAGDKA